MLFYEKYENILYGDLILGSPKILSYHFSGVFPIPFFKNTPQPKLGKIFRSHLDSIMEEVF